MPAALGLPPVAGPSKTLNLLAVFARAQEQVEEEEERKEREEVKRGYIQDAMRLKKEKELSKSTGELARGLDELDA